MPVLPYLFPRDQHERSGVPPSGQAGRTTHPVLEGHFDITTTTSAGAFAPVAHDLFSHSEPDVPHVTDDSRVERLLTRENLFSEPDDPHRTAQPGADGRAAGRPPRDPFTRTPARSDVFAGL